MHKKLDLNLLDTIHHHVGRLNYKDHNLSFTNMYLWNDVFQLEVYDEENFLLVFSKTKDEYFSLNPICTKDDIQDAIEYLKKHFKEQNKPFIIHNCVKSCKEEIENIYGDYFTYTETRDTFDYLYSVEKMLTYSGKKLQKKRNHVNSFKKTYEGRYEVKKFDPHVIEDCHHFLKNWYASKKVNDEYLPEEVKGVDRVLKAYFKLKCEGIAVYIDDEIVGFNIGTQLNDTTAVVNIEKADPSINGLYPFIRQELIKTYFDDLVYINTEDDIGDEGLRKSKLSYQPEYLVQKFTIRVNENYGK